MRVLETVELPAHVLNLAHGRVDLAQHAHQPGCQVELGRHVVNGRPRARILDDRERRRQHPIADRQLYGIAPGHGQHAARIALVECRSLDQVGQRIPQVPRHAVHSRRHLEARRRSFQARRAERRASGRIDDVDAYRGLAGGRADDVVETRAVRRILPEPVDGNHIGLALVHPDGRGRREEVRGRAGDLRRRVAERRDVVEHPERPAMRRHGKIVAVERDVANRGRRQVELQRLPVVAIVERDENARLGAGEEQSLPFRVLSHGVDVRRGLQPLGDGRPRLPAIVRPVDIGREIVELVRVDGDVCRVGVEVRRFDERDLRPLLQARRRDPRPVRSRVRGELHQAVVGSDPDHAGGHRRGGDRVDDVVGTRPTRCPG